MAAVDRRSDMSILRLPTGTTLSAMATVKHLHGFCVQLARSPGVVNQMQAAVNTSASTQCHAI